MQKLYCVGVGPGEPKLLTIAAKDVIESAEVIFAPTSSRRLKSFALDVVRMVADVKHKRVVPLTFPMTLDRARRNMYYERAYRKIKEVVLSGKTCVLLVEGDPLIYSTFVYILELIVQRKEFDVEIIPGISSFQLMAARLKVPIVSDGEVLSVVSASYEESDGKRTARLPQGFRRILKSSDTIFIMKAAKVISEILREKKGFIGFFGELCGTEKEFLSELTDELIKRKNHYFSTVMLKGKKK